MSDPFLTLTQVTYHNLKDHVTLELSQPRHFSVDLSNTPWIFRDGSLAAEVHQDGTITEFNTQVNSLLSTLVLNNGGACYNEMTSDKGAT